MSLLLREKIFFHRARRHRREGSNPVVAPDGRTLAWLQTEAEAETLMLQPTGDQPARPVSAPGYIFSPAFAGTWLVWSERGDGETWRICGVPWASEGTGAPAPRILYADPSGRPIHLCAVATPGGAWLAWEERRGTATAIRLGLLADDGSFSVAPRAVSPAEVNAYDPALAVAPDGGVYCAWCAYSDFNYRIFLARFDPAGQAIGGPRRVSDQSEACVWPSLWPAKNGGVWFSFTGLSVANGGRPEQTQLRSYVKHERYLRQRQFFGAHGLAQVGYCDAAGRLHVPQAGPRPEERQFFTAAGIAFGTEGAGHTQVIEDGAGRVHLLLRQHARVERLLPAEKASPPLAVHPRFAAKQPAQTHPNLAIATLGPEAWEPPQVIVPRAHFDLALSVNSDGSALTVAFAEDARLTGWSGGGEWFDDVGEVGVGLARLALAPSIAAPDYLLCPLAIAPFAAGRLGNPPADAARAAELWPGRQFALGQTHCHSNLSVCRRELDRDSHFNYRFMQDVQHAGFGMLTDHEYNLWQTEMLLGRKLAEYYYFSGAFVALPGYEWTGSDARDCAHDGGPFGHVNLVSFEPLHAGDFQNPSDPASPGNSLAKLWQVGRDRKWLTPPHHVVDLAHPYNWNFWSDEFEPFIEIFQDDRGSGEQEGAPGQTNSTRVRPAVWAVDALRRGRRFGFVAGGDHSGVALGGVWTAALTREALYQAFRARCCYATTGIHAAILFTANGQPMGGEATGTPAEFCLQVVSAESVARVEVLCNGQLVSTFGPDASGRWTWRDAATRAGDFWYCRVHWASGELAWTSPVWI